MTDPAFLIDEDDRYSRLRLIGWWDQHRLANAKVMVVGAGALGNEVLKNLALIGVGHITIVDFDQVETSNLSRAVLLRPDDAGTPKATAVAKSIRLLNPEIEINAIDGNVLTDIGLGLVREMDLVIGCLDNREARWWVNRMCWKVNVPWIDGGIQEINGVVQVFSPPHGSCYECGMTETDYKLIQLRYSCPQLPREDLMAGKVPTAPTIAAIIAGMQVQEALKMIHGLPVSDGVALVFSGAANQLYQTKLPRREDCLSHETYGRSEPTALTHLSTARQLMQLGRDTAGKGDASLPFQLRLDRDLVISLRCDQCDLDTEIMRARQAIRQIDSTCPSCQQLMRPVTTCTIDEHDPLCDQPLARLSIPDQDIVELSIDGKCFWYELQAAR